MNPDQLPQTADRPGGPPVTRHAQDLQLVERMLGGDDDAFNAFGERYFRPCYRYTLKRLDGDRERTRDTVQTAMTKALTHLDTYRGEASLFTWLCACCRNEILMGFRRRDSRPRAVELDGAPVERELSPAAGSGHHHPASPERDLLRREDGLRVHLALDLLPENYAHALEWKYVERLSVRELGRRLEVSTKAAESLLSRARQAFRSAYLELDHDGPARALEARR